MILSASLAYFLLSAQPAASASDVVHYPPISSNINNLTFVLGGSGAPGIYNSSSTDDVRYGMYNWCNMPHVRKREYKSPPKEYELRYVEVIQRHHKRTPYASNTFFKEDVAWSCQDEGATFGATSPQFNPSPVQWQTYRDSTNPWTTTVGPGFVGSSCQFPQITAQGLQDSYTHGTDLREVYGQKLSFHDELDPRQIRIRVTNNVITSQVASGLLRGLFPHADPSALSVLIQPSAFDSLEPTYSCPRSSSIRSSYTTGSAGQQWQDHLKQAAPLYSKLDKISGTSPQDSAGWHTSFDHYYDNFSAKQCHGKSLPCSVNDTSLCVSQQDADTVYRLGNWEYSWQYRDAPDSAKYAALRYGVWVLELKSHLQGKVDGSSNVKYFHNVAHDGSISSLLGFLQISQMVWPGMGSEVVFELYSKKSAYYIRVLWGGQPLRTSTPLGVLDMVLYEDFIAYIDKMVGSSQDLYAECNQ
ncbi:histidine phosphatase [Panaeolus papilionaceus]|nr:histidine phosphatase [Panaeolus papilionaceus]